MGETLRETLHLLTSSTECMLEDMENARRKIKVILDPNNPQHESQKKELLNYVNNFIESADFITLNRLIKELLVSGVEEKLVREIIFEWQNSANINLIVLAKKVDRWIKTSQAKVEEKKDGKFIDLLALTDSEKGIISFLCELRFYDEAVKRYRIFRLFPEALVKGEPRNIAVLSSKEEMVSCYGRRLKDIGFKLFTSFAEACKAIEERRYYNFIVIDLAQPRSEEIERQEIESAKKIIDKLFKVSDKLQYVQFSLSNRPDYTEVKYNDQWYYYYVQNLNTNANPYVIAKIKEDLFCLQLEDEQLPEQHRDFLWLFANPNAKKIVYKQIKSGFSGSANYLIYTVDDYEQFGEPVIIKITTSDKAIDEEERYRKIIKPWIPGSPIVTKKVYRNEEVGAVCYQYAYQRPGIQSRTFKELFISGEQPISELCVLIDELLSKKLMRFNNTRGWLSRTVKKEFSDYIKEGKISESFEAILPNCIGDNEVELYNERFTNPVTFWNSIKKRDEEFPSKLVHGDLHTENIMIDEDNQVFLIDYAKARDKAHLFIDHAMLEVSVKLDLLHRSTPYSEIISFEKNLCSWGSLDEDAYYNGPYEELDSCLLIIKCIRNLSKLLLNRIDSQIGSFDPLYHYYLVLFCMTFAQLAYKDMNQQYALISSGLLAKRLSLM